MALDCRIINNQVIAPNGEPSLLFQSLENKFGRDKALDYYALTEDELYLPAIVNKDSNGEMLLEDFLKFSLDRTPITSLIKEKLDLQLRVGTEGFNRLKKSIIKNGVIQIDRQTLENSNIFTEDEINQIVNNQTVINNLEDLVRQPSLDAAEPISSPYLTTSNNYNGIGIKPYLDPLEVKNEVLKVTSKASNVQEVYSLINTIEYPEIIEQFKNNPVVRNQIISDSLQSKEVRKDYDNLYVQETILNSLSVDNLEEVSQISEEILSYTDKDLINDEFLNLLDSLKNLGLPINLETYDVLNLSEQQIKSVTEATLGFSQLPNTQNTQTFANTIGSIMQLEESVIVNTSNIDPKVQNLVSIDTLKNEVEIFEEKGYIRHGKGIYQKIDDKYSTTQLYDILYNKVVYGELNIETPSVENQEQLEEPLNKEGVIKDIQDFIKSQTSLLPVGDTNTLEKIAIYKYFYNAPQKIEEVSTQKAVVDNEQYLKNEFVSEFSRYINFNRDRNTKEYDSFLKFFKITDKGIELKNNSEYTMLHLNNTINEIDPIAAENLNQYSKLSKHLNLQVEDTPAVTDNFTTEDNRILYSQNPSLVKTLDKEYANISESSVAVEDIQDDFIKIKEDVYEKTIQYKNTALYNKLPRPDKVYHITNLEKPVPDISYTELESYTKEQQEIQANQIIGDIELEEINNEYFNC